MDSPLREQVNFLRFQAEAIRTASEIADALERGQANKPFSEEIERLNSMGMTSLSVALFSINSEAQGTVLRWLIGPHYHLVTVRLFEISGLVDIQLQERGFAIETPGAGRQEFLAPNQFATALEESLGVFVATPDSIRSIAVGIAAPPALQNLRVTILPPPETVTQQAALPATLARSPKVLLVAYSPDYSWNSSDILALQMVAPACAALWPISVGGNSDGPKFRVAQPLARLGLPVLASSQLNSAESAFVPDFVVQGPAHPIRVGLSAVLASRSAVSLTEMLSERFDSDSGQLKVRLKRESRFEKGNDAATRDQTARTEFEKLKVRANEEFANLNQAIREHQRRALAKIGDIGLVLQELAESIHPADLDREEATKAIRLSLNRNTLDEVKKRFSKTAQRLLDNECTVIRDSFDLLRKNTEERLESVGSKILGIRLSAPDNREIWESVHDLVNLEIKYHGEIAKRGFLQRLGEARRVVYGGLMILSLIGGFMGVNLRRAAFVGVALLFVFIGAVAYTYRSWKKEDEEIIEREIEKVRQGIASELERLAAGVFRDLQARLMEFVDQSKRDFLTQLDNIAKQTQIDFVNQIDSEKRDSATKVRLLEQREKELQGLGQQITRLRQQANQMMGSATMLLNEAIAQSSGEAA